MRWNYSKPPEDRPIIRWHVVYKCPVTVMWKPDIVEGCPWVEKTLSNSWPEESFKEDIWMEVLDEPLTKEELIGKVRKMKEVISKIDPSLFP